MTSPIEYNCNRDLGLQWSIDTVIVGGKVKKRVRVKGYSSNRVTIIGDSIVQMISDMNHTSIQAICGAYAHDIVNMYQDGIYKIQGFEAIVVFAGSNDLCKYTILEILVSFRRIVHHIRAENPTTHIAICGILARPCEATDDTKVKKHSDMNEALKADCKVMNVSYVNSEKALNGMGSVDKLFMPDKIHLSNVGVGLLMTYLEGIAGSLLGIPPQWDPVLKQSIPRK